MGLHTQELRFGWVQDYLQESEVSGNHEDIVTPQYFSMQVSPYQCLQAEKLLQAIEETQYEYYCCLSHGDHSRHQVHRKIQTIAQCLCDISLLLSIRDKFRSVSKSTSDPSHEVTNLYVAGTFHVEGKKRQFCRGIGRLALCKEMSLKVKNGSVQICSVAIDS